MAAATPAIRSRMTLFASSITKDLGAAELLVNDTIVKCAQMADPEKVPPYKIVSYLMTMLRNAAFSWFRHDRVVRAHLRVPRDLTSKSALAEAISREAVEYFKSLVADLPRSFRRVILLSVIENLTYDQISKRLKIPVGTVMSRMYRARQTLLPKFSDYLKAEA